MLGLLRIPLAVIGFCMLAALPVASQCAAVSPEAIDSAFFGPLGALSLGAGAAVSYGGLGGLIGVSLTPYPKLGLEGPVLAAAPIHVGGLVAAGFNDLTTDSGFGIAPAAGFIVVLLGGLWSKRLAPHREIWSWDVVEITALDLLAADTIADHLWTSRSAPAGVHWGGGEVRLFRAGLSASHHHLSAAGAASYATSIWLPTRYLASFSLPCFVAYPTQTPAVMAPLRVATCPPVGPLHGAPLAAGELSLLGWALALFAPSSAALSAWGLWGGYAYLWLIYIPLFGYIAARPGAGQQVWWLHYPLVPLGHLFAAPLPWSPSIVKLRSIGP